MRPLVPLVVALLLTGAAGTAVSTPQSSEYSMSTPGEVEIPARTLTVDGDDYTVGAVGRVVPGDTIRVDVAAPENAEYSVYLYNREFQIEQTDRMSGSGRATFSTGSLSPGSYMAAVYDGEILEVYPVVVEGYDVTVEAPSSVDSEFDVTVEVVDGALTREPPEVQVVMGDDERSVRVDASRVSDGEYRATVSPDGFDDGTYALYGVVRGENETDGGDRVLLAVSDRHEVEVASTATATPTAEPDDGNGGDGGGGGGGAPPGSDADGEVRITDRALLNGTATAGTEVFVRVDLSNADPTRGLLALNLTVDGSLVASEQVAVAASTDRTVRLGHRFDEPGTYTVAVNGVEVGTVTVTDETATPTDTVTPGTPAETPTPSATSEAVVTPRPTTTAPPATTTTGDGAGFGPVVAVSALALALAVLGLRRR